MHWAATCNNNSKPFKSRCYDGQGLVVDGCWPTLADISISEFVLQPNICIGHKNKKNCLPLFETVAYNGLYVDRLGHKFYFYKDNNVLCWFTGSQR